MKILALKNEDSSFFNENYTQTPPLLYRHPPGLGHYFDLCTARILVINESY
jgi:hypothetical protein